MPSTATSPSSPPWAPIGGDPAATTASFSHATEVASPGNYAVTVGSPRCAWQLAVTTRAGLGRFSFPGTAPANVLFKVADSAAGSAALRGDASWVTARWTARS